MCNYLSTFSTAERTTLSDLHATECVFHMMPRNNLGSSTLQGPGWSRVLLAMLSHIRSDNSTLRTSPFLDPTNKNGMQWSPVRTFGRILLAVHSSSFSPGYHIKSSLAFFPLSIKRLGNACGLFNSYPSKQVISQGKRFE